MPIFVKGYARAGQLVHGYSKTSIIKKLKVSRNIEAGARRSLGHTTSTEVAGRARAEIRFQTGAQKRTRSALKKKIAAGITQRRGPGRLGAQTRLYNRYGLKRGF